MSFRTCVVAAMLTPVVAAAPPDAIEIKERLAVTDPMDPVRRQFAKTFQVKLQKGKTYQFDHSSQVFDAYLRLSDGKGQDVARDDDGGGGRNARIRYTAPDDDVYTVHCTSLGGGTGAFVLTIQGPGAQLVGFKGAPAVVAGALLDVKGVLVDTDMPDPVRRNPSRMYHVNLKKDVAYQIDMTSAELDPYVRVEDAEGREVAKEGGAAGGRIVRLRFTPEKDGPYKVFATTFNGGTGAYRIVVRPSGGGVGPIAGPVAGRPLDVAAVLGKNDPIDPVRNSPSKVHFVQLKGGKSYQIDLMSKNFDCYLRLEDPTGQPLAEDDDGGEGLNSRLVFDCPADGRYRIVATTFNNEVGPYALRVTER